MCGAGPVVGSSEPRPVGAGRGPLGTAAWVGAYFMVLNSAVIAWPSTVVSVTR